MSCLYGVFSSTHFTNTDHQCWLLKVANLFYLSVSTKKLCLIKEIKMNLPHPEFLTMHTYLGPLPPTKVCPPPCIDMSNSTQIFTHTDKDMCICSLLCLPLNGHTHTCTHLHSTIVSYTCVNATSMLMHVYSHLYTYMFIDIYMHKGSTHGVMVTVEGNEHSDLSSNPIWDCLHFTLC